MLPDEHAKVITWRLGRNASYRNSLRLAGAAAWRLPVIVLRLLTSSVTRSIEALGFLAIGVIVLASLLAFTIGAGLVGCLSEIEDTKEEEDADDPASS